ncbi:MAG TPA: Ig-like domain-containing protein [Gemmatimonadales bacterium]|nr:Ig-like domain-containing protein [Gemmatimonadales bacterium]
MYLSSHFRQRLPALLLSLLAACGGEDLVLPDEGIPTSIVVVDGNAQAGTIGTKLADSVVVRVLDVQGRPVQGQQVSFTVMTGGGSVDPATAATTANGQASTSWTLGPAAGTQQLRARATGGAAPADLSVAISATASASAASAIEAISGSGQSATAGSTLADSLIVRVTDAAENPVAGIAVAWTVTGGGSVSEPSTVTGADGRTGVRRTLGTTAGPQTTIATVAGLDGSPVTFPATATVGSAGQLVVTLQPSSTASSGAAFAQQPRVQIQDANGNNVAAVGRAITAELVSGPAGSSLIGTPTVATNAGGLAIFSSLGITGPAGSYTLNFTGANLTGATSAAITLTAGAATRLAFSGQPSNATAGSSIAPPVQVTIQDALGQTVTTATNAVTVSLGTNPGSGALSGATTVNAVAGVATFPNLAINRAGTGYRLAASASGLTGASSATFNIVAGPASEMAASATIPATTTAGSVVVPDAAVRVTDASDNPVAGISVTFSPVNGGSVAGETQTTNAQGIATIGSWTIGGTAGTAYQLQAEATGLAPVIFSTTAVAGAAGELTIETQPGGTAQSGVALVPQPSVQLRDGSGNPVNQSGIAITAQFGSGPTATLSNATASTNSSGRATFSGLTITGPAGTYTLTFGGPGVSGVASDPIVLGSGAATKLGIVQQPPASVENGALFDPAPVVELHDAAGNPVGTPGVNIDVTIVSGIGALSGTLTATTNSAGQAIFPDLRITGLVGNRTLRFSADIPVSTVNSSTVQVTPGPVSATQSLISAAPSTIAASNPGSGGTTITVTARDQSTNAIAGAPVVLNALQGAGSFGAIAPTGPTGTTTASYTSTSAGAKIIGATIDGVTIDAEQPITVTAATATAANSDFSVSPATITVNGPGATATVIARDEFDNLVSGADVIVSVTNGLASPSTGQTNAGGAFASTITSGTVGTHTVSATVEGAALPDQTIEVTAIPTTTSVTTSGTPSTTGGSVTFTATVSASSQPGGSVSFYDGGSCGAPGAVIGTDVVSPGTGTASVATAALAAGAHTIIACYPGNSIFAPSEGSVAQTVNEPANESPTAAAHAFDATEDQALVVPVPGVLAGASDSDGTIAGALAGDGPDHGTLDLQSDGAFTYTPEADYNGPDSFTYRVVDDDGAQSAAQTVTLTVAPVDEP